MTRGQRRLHLWMWLVIGPLAVAAVVLAVMLRPAVPVQEGVAPGASQDDGQPAVAHGEADQ